MIPVRVVLARRPFLVSYEVVYGGRMTRFPAVSPLDETKDAVDDRDAGRVV